MTTCLDALGIRRRLGRDIWGPPKAFGPDGWMYRSKDGANRASVIVSAAYVDGATWVHASISRETWMPDYRDLKTLHGAVWPDGHAYQCFVPPEQHVNIHEHALHLWGRADGAPVLPEFALDGFI